MERFSQSTAGESLQGIVGYGFEGRALFHKDTYVALCYTNISFVFGTIKYAYPNDLARRCRKNRLLLRYQGNLR